MPHPYDDGREAHLSIARRGAVAVIEQAGKLLVIRRARGIVAAGALCFPGGGIEAGESESEALVREIREELGVTIQPVRRIWQCVTPWRVSLAWWLGSLPQGARLAPNPSEVESILWHTPAELAELPGLLESNRQFLAALAAGEIVL
jgi:(d)CTP diphosphatase